MDNYYEVLEISPNASREIIDKAYKILAKRYHPDVHPEEKKAWAEEKFKKVNEAYDILSDSEKKEIYDTELSAQNLTYQNKYEKLYRENLYLKKQLQYFKQIQNNYNSINYINNNVSDNYYNYENNHNIASFSNYEKQEKKFEPKISSKDIIALFLTILFIFLVFCILFAIPVTRNYIYREFPFISNIIEYITNN